MKQHNRKPKYKIGDRVTVAGYGAKVFEIDSITVSYMYEAGKEFSEIVYDATNVSDVTDFIIAEEEEITPLLIATVSLKTLTPEDCEEPTLDDLLDRYIDAALVAEICGEDEESAEAKAEIMRLIVTKAQTEGEASV